MGKPAYPGLVVVPPSDRQIFRRRLATWSFLTIGAIAGISAFTDWLPAPDHRAHCQTVTVHGASIEVREDCEQPSPSVAEAQLPQNESVVTEVPRQADQAEPHSLVAMVTSNPGKPTTEPKKNQVSQVRSSDPAKNASNPTATPPQKNQVTASRNTDKPALSPNPDTRLAERGDAFAQYRLGRFFAQRGKPYQQDAVSWYAKAADGLQRLAEAGNGEAMYVLGVMNAFGRGVAKDHDQARHWLTQAVERQVAAARPVLASLKRRHQRTDTDADLQVSLQFPRVRHEN
jgi:uncharacterized protein